MDGLSQNLPVLSARLLPDTPGDPRGSRREPAVIVVPPPSLGAGVVVGRAVYGPVPAGAIGLLVDVYG